MYGRIHANLIGYSKSKERQLQLGTSFEKLRVTIGLGKIVYLHEQCNDLGKGDLSYKLISSVTLIFLILNSLGSTSSIFIAIDFATSLSYEESYRSCFSLLAKSYATSPSFEDSDEAWLWSFYCLIKISSSPSTSSFNPPLNGLKGILFDMMLINEVLLSILFFQGVHMLTILSTPYMDTPKIMSHSISCCVRDLDLW